MNSENRPFGITFLSAVFAIFGVLMTIPVPIGVFLFARAAFGVPLEIILASIGELTVSAGIFIAVGAFASLLYISSYGLWKLKTWGLTAAFSVLVIGLLLDIGVLLNSHYKIVVLADVPKGATPPSIVLKVIAMWYLYSYRNLFE